MSETEIKKILSSVFSEPFDAGYPKIITLKKTGLPSFRMVYLPGGTFLMGDDNGKYNDEKPAHEVKLNAFYMSEFPVTQNVYEAITGNNPANFRGLLRPVEQVSWFDSVNFFNKLSEKFGIQQCYKKTDKDKFSWNKTKPGFRLPTEAEWEYAANGGGKGNTQYAGSNKLENVGWYDENSYGETKNIGMKFPNAAGLYDMSGNVWEWCYDWFGEDFYKQCKKGGIENNPDGPESGAVRVLRGGSWDSFADNCRAACRNSFHPGIAWSGGGFRVVFGL